MSKLLYDEKPLVINPELARSIGLSEAIILQQIHYWVSINEKAQRNLLDGNYWTYNSYTEWHEQFPFWSRNTIIRAIKRLEAKGFLISANYNRLPQDKTKWYRIDYEALPKLSSPSTQIDEANIPDRVEKDTKVSKALPETSTEIISKTNTILFSAIISLPYWSKSLDDVVWVKEFVKEFSDLLESDIKECRDYYDGRRARHKGIWKNRLRNWMKKKREFSGNGSKKPGVVPSEVELEAQARRLKVGS